MTISFVTEPFVVVSVKGHDHLVRNGALRSRHEERVRIFRVWHVASFRMQLFTLFWTQEVSNPPHSTSAVVLQNTPHVLIGRDNSVRSEEVKGVRRRLLLWAPPAHFLC